MRQPRPYQTIAREFFTDTPRAALWAKPGMGKTGSTLLALKDLMLVGDVERVLVIAPRRVAEDVWSDEVKRWPGLETLRVSTIVGTAAQRRAALMRPADLYTVNFEVLPWLIKEMNGEWWFDTVVVDEASKLRGFRTKQGTARTRALAPFAHTKIRRFYELTGTPAANSLAALWGQIWFLDNGARLGRSFEAFKQRWFSSHGDPVSAKLTPLPYANEQINEALSDICLTLRPGDWFDLREPVYTRVNVELPKPVRSMYKVFKREMYMALKSGEEVTAFSAAAKTMKCLQLASGAVYTNPEATLWSEVHTAKMEALESIVEETTDSAVIAVYQFRADKERILKKFPGSVDLATKAGLAKFKAGGAQVGVAHPASLGHGVDGLQNVCNAMAFFSSGWDAEEREQIIERVGPMRQLQADKDRALFLYDIVAKGTIDEVVMTRHETKREVQDLLMEAMRRDPA